jgi:hypothetical protein
MSENQLEKLPSSETKSRELKRKPSFISSWITLLVSLSFFTGLNLVYAENKPAFELSSSSAFYADLTLVLLLVGVAFLCASVFLFLRVEIRNHPIIDSNSRVSYSVGGIIAETIFRNRKLIALVAIVYGVVFALLDGILIYQPTVDFATVYGVTNPSTVVETCCGPPGYVPVGLVYFPLQHLGLQLIPMSLLIMILVSVLVGVNVSLLIASIEKSRPLTTMNPNAPSTRANSSFLGSAVGAVFGVFAGCPTCAAAFFLSMIAGSGATAFSLTISQFQPVIILVSIPLLFGSIAWQARSMKKIMLGCSL